MAGIVVATFAKRGNGTGQYAANEDDSEYGKALSSRQWARLGPTINNNGDVTCSRPLCSNNIYRSTQIGAVDRITRLSSHSSPEQLPGVLNRIPEDAAMEFDRDDRLRYTGSAPADENNVEEWERDDELAELGLYRGSYLRLVLIYTIAPLTWIFAFTFFAFLPSFVYPIDRRASESPYPYAPYLPFPVPEFLLSVALWSLVHLLRDPLYLLTSTPSLFFPALSPTFPILCSTTLHTVASVLFRLATIPLLLIPHYTLSEYPTAHDPAFRRVWWVALGWAAAEAVAGTKQGYEWIALYRDVLVTVHPTTKSRSGKDMNGQNAHWETEDETPRNHGEGSSQVNNVAASGPSGPALRESNTIGGSQYQDLDDEESSHHDIQGDGERQLLLPRHPDNRRQGSQVEDILQMQVDRDLDRLIALRNREELEEAYGIPMIRIPVFISCLQRINSLLLSLGVYLLLSSTYMRSTFAVASTPNTSAFIYTVYDSAGDKNKPLIIMLPLIIILQLLLAVLYTPLVLPRIGVHSVVYVGSLVSLGAFFAGLGFWEALS